MNWLVCGKGDERESWMARGISAPRATLLCLLNLFCLPAAPLLAARAIFPLPDTSGSAGRRPGAWGGELGGEAGWREGARGGLIESVRLRGGSGNTGRETWKGNGDDERVELRSADDVFMRPRNTGTATTLVV